MALFRVFVFSRSVFSFFRVALFRGEKMKRRNGTNQPPYFADLRRSAVGLNSKHSESTFILQDRGWLLITILDFPCNLVVVYK